MLVARVHLKKFKYKFKKLPLNIKNERNEQLKVGRSMLAAYERIAKILNTIKHPMDIYSWHLAENEISLSANR